MDDFSITGEVMDTTLLEIERINQLLGGNDVTISGLSYLLKKSKNLPKHLTITDLGCGGGEMLELMDKKVRKLGFISNLIGIDANPYIIGFCRSRYKNQANFEFTATDVLSKSMTSRQSDIVTATLFMHHFETDQLIELIRRLKNQARFGIVINDLHRHWFAYYSILFLTKLLSKSSMVKYDAPMSVKRAFKRSDWAEILEKAGIQNYRLQWKWAFRWQVVIVNKDC